MNAAHDVARLLARGRPLLLDFDGPICRIFAGCPASVVARQLVDLIQHHGVALPVELVNESDPLEVIRWRGLNGMPDLARAVEDALCAAEMQAVETAEPTPYGREAIVAARQAGCAVGVVSNNSPGAVTAYLTAHRLAEHVFPVVGRPYAEPARMKPNAEPILHAVRTLGVAAGDCVLIGDSVSDIEAARAAGVPAIGYANVPAKVGQLVAAGAEVVVTTMGAVARALMALAERDTATG